MRKQLPVHCDRDGTTKTRVKYQRIRSQRRALRCQDLFPCSTDWLKMHRVTTLANHMRPSQTASNSASLEKVTLYSAPLDPSLESSICRCMHALGGDLATNALSQDTTNCV
jgi:hypothetical protein